MPSGFPSIRVFSSKSSLCIRWPKNWSFSFSVSLSNECSGLISFRIDWFDLLSVQGILNSLDWLIQCAIRIYFLSCMLINYIMNSPFSLIKKIFIGVLLLYNVVLVSAVQEGKSAIRSDQIRSVAQSCPTLRPHELQHARPPCPSPTPGAHWDSRLLSQWCHPAISSSVVPFSSCPQSLPASESFPMSQLFAWDGQSTGVSASASFLPKKSQGWSPSEWTGWTPCSPGDSQESSPTPQFKSINSSALSLLHSPTLTSIHDHRKNHSLD